MIPSIAISTAKHVTEWVEATGRHKTGDPLPHCFCAYHYHVQITAERHCVGVDIHIDLGSVDDEDGDGESSAEYRNNPVKTATITMTKAEWVAFRAYVDQFFADAEGSNQ